MPKKYPGATILLRILIRDQRVEDRDDLGADLGHRGNRDDEDEIVAADVADEALLVTHAFDDVVQNLRENSDDAIALVIRVPIVELLEVIEVGVARRERHVEREAPRDVALDLHRARQPRRRVDVEVAIRPAQQASSRITTSTRPDARG